MGKAKRSGFKYRWYASFEPLFSLVIFLVVSYKNGIKQHSHLPHILPPHRSLIVHIERTMYNDIHKRHD